MSEEWRNVPEYEGLYQVSNQGRVRRVAGSPKCHTTRYLRPVIRKDGYLVVALSKNGRPVSHTVHSIVLAAFDGPRGDGKWINHRNGRKNDNRLSNLEYCTPGENTQHAYDTGLQPDRHGEGNGQSKLTDDQVITIRRLATLGVPRRRLREMFSVSQTTITEVVNRNLWKHVGE